MKETLDNGRFSHELEIYFHQKIATVAGNAIICLVMDSVRDMLVGIKDLIHTDHEFSVAVFLAHKRILDALRMRDPDRARSEMYRHIKEVEEGLISYFAVQGPGRFTNSRSANSG
jgi:DNA-binding FadR family transcriptional regulator